MPRPVALASTRLDAHAARGALDPLNKLTGPTSVIGRLMMVRSAQKEQVVRSAQKEQELLALKAELARYVPGTCCTPWHLLTPCVSFECE